MLARRPPSVLQQQRQQRARALAAPPCRRPLPAAASPTAHRRLAASAVPPPSRDGATASAAPLTAATTTEQEEAQAASSSSIPPAASWEDLYIIPSSFDDDDEGDDDRDDDAASSTKAPAAVRAWPGCGPIVVLPGFGNDTQDYESPFGDARRGLAPRLRRRGFVVETVRLRRRDWLRVAKAVASPSFWKGTADVGPGYRWYLLRVAAAVRRAEAAWMERHGVGDGANATAPPRVTLVGHSAGGWLARAFLGDASLRPEAVAEAAQREEDRALAALAEATNQQGKLKEALATAREVFFSRSLALEAAGGAPVPCRERPHPSVGAVVTLGTPHTPPSGDGARDVTGGALAWVNEHWPGAYFGKNGGGGGGEDGGGQRRVVVYVAVAGRAVFAPPADVAVPRGSPPSYAREAYRTVAGDAGRSVAASAASASEEDGPVALSTPSAVVGDAVVPLSVAAGGLPGADARVVLDGVWHSMSRLGTFKEAPEASGGGGGSRSRSEGVRPWYGSGRALDAWLAALCEEDEKAAARGG